MKQCKQVLGLPIMGMKEGITKGIAVDFVIDPQEKTIRYLILKSVKGYGFQMLAIDDVLGVGSDFIMTSTVDNAKNIFSCPELLQQLENASYGSDLLDASALSTAGNVMPNMAEFTFDEKTGKLEKLLLEDGSEYDASQVAVLSQDVVFFDAIYPAEDEEVEEEFVATEEIEEPVVEEEVIVEEEPVAEVIEEVEEVAEEPELTIFQQAQRAFLVGHTVTSDVVDHAGTVVIPAGTKVTEKTVRLAEDQGVSAELALSVD